MEARAKIEAWRQDYNQLASAAIPRHGSFKPSRPEEVTALPRHVATPCEQMRLPSVPIMEANQRLSRGKNLPACKSFPVTKRTSGVCEMPPERPRYQDSASA